MNTIDLNQTARTDWVFDRPGNYFLYFVNRSGDYRFRIAASRVNLTIRGIYLAGQDTHFELRTVQEHQVPASKSDLFVKGIFFGRSQFHYRGLIKIERKAQKSDAFQKNQNLLLSEQCQVTSRPDLEILADDVYCTHASTSGRIDQEQLQYLRSRGLSPTAAQRLLMHGFIDEIAAEIKRHQPDFRFPYEKHQPD
ncbi:SufD family Fe-S cluster assembly protein [Patescibacteria group bacterium]|nr:SufD family Fe-S cluster assembly protein [Patescibacteria group bacterium]MCL5091205.1 SufD family Fe-S cluster assembly protein [Patescibacteria group bacterium]